MRARSRVGLPGISNGPSGAIRAQAGLEEQTVGDRRRPRGLAVLAPACAGSPPVSGDAVRRQAAEAERADHRVRRRLRAAAVAVRRERGAVARKLLVPVMLNLLRGVAWQVKRTLSELEAFGALRLPGRYPAHT